MAQRPESFPESEVNTALSFFQHVRARFASDPAIYEEFLRVLRGFRTGETPDRRQVTAKAHALLRGHPDLARRLDAFFPAPEPAREAPAPTRPKRERRPTPAAAADHDAGTRRALRFFERVRRRRAGLHDRLLDLIFDASSEEADLNQIYQRARQLFGPDHDDLLHQFTGYLPVPTGHQRDLLLRHRAREEEERRAPPAPKRKAAAVAADKPGRAKRPRDDGRKTANRRGHSPAVVVSAFREAWEFETTYTKLVATARRTKELLKAYEPSEDAPPPTRGRRAFEELFPSRECQEVLQEMYHSLLGPIQAALEDSARTELALRTIQRRLGMLEQAAVKVAMERRDRARVEGRMNKLAVDWVLVLRDNKAKQSAGRFELVLQ